MAITSSNTHGRLTSKSPAGGTGRPREVRSMSSPQAIYIRTGGAEGPWTLLST